MRIVMVMSSADFPSGDVVARLARLKAFAGPYYLFQDAGHEVTLASPSGGAPPLAWAPPADVADPLLVRYRLDRDARDLLSDTLTLDQIFPEDFELAFYPGGGAADTDALDDVARNLASQRLLTALWPRAPIALVGSALGALATLAAPDGGPLVARRRVATSGERLDHELRELGAVFERGGDGPQVVVDGLLVTAPSDRFACEAAAAALRARA